MHFDVLHHKHDRRTTQGNILEMVENMVSLQYIPFIRFFNRDILIAACQCIKFLLFF